MTIYQCHVIRETNPTTNQLSVLPHLFLNVKINELKGKQQAKTAVKLFC